MTCNATAVVMHSYSQGGYVYYGMLEQDRDYIISYIVWVS